MSHRKFILVTFLCILVTLSATQIILDYISEAKADTSISSYIQPPKYQILIDIEDKTLYLLKNGEYLKKYAISSGKSGLPSPLGAWRIVEKSDWGEGFGGRWMGLDVPWGTYGIHGTFASESIGIAASHGCIRMFIDDVKELYSIVPVGTEVAIVNGLYGPFGRGFDEMYPGDRGADIMAVQQRLKQLGYYTGPIDGIYKDDLKFALHRFQKDHGITPDNAVNKESWNAMGFREFE